MDGADPQCFENPYCVVVIDGAPEPSVQVEKAGCGGATLSGPFDVIRGQVSQMTFAGGSVDLGNVVCVAGGLAWDRVTDLSSDPDPICNDTVVFFVARHTGAGDFGAAGPGGEPRDTMNPDPVCP